CVAARLSGALGRIRLEHKISAGELIAYLIEIHPVEFEAGAKHVLAFSPGYVIDQLKVVVIDDIWAIGIIAKTGKAIAIDPDGRNAPSGGQPGFQARDS